MNYFIITIICFKEKQIGEERERGGGGGWLSWQKNMLGPKVAPQTVEQCLITTYAWTLR